MATLLHQLILETAGRTPTATALLDRSGEISYGELNDRVMRFAWGVANLGVSVGGRVAIYLPKTVDTVVAMFGTAAAGRTFVPVNPQLKGRQVAHILADCEVELLVTSADKLTQIRDDIGACPSLRSIVLAGGEETADQPGKPAISSLAELYASRAVELPARVDADMTAIFYTSGSTGKPKGVVLSHRNMVAGAVSVSTYLENHADDRLLAVLPFSFDYGFSQLSTAFASGASVALLNFLLPRDVLRAASRFAATGLAAVPPLWIQLAELDWPADVQAQLRYITNSGGAMPTATLKKLRAALPNTSPYLMYGLTEAFRSTYLPPAELDRRPTSMGKAIPNADVRVLRPDGSECETEEIGELVHRGALVSLGYWNDKARTAERFRPVAAQHDGLVLPELAVWSGDLVRRDADGFLYFMGRRDEMIKTSGYRVSPSEVEEAAYRSGLLGDAVALGIPHPQLGQGIVLTATRNAGKAIDDSALTEQLLAACRQELPNYMIPARVIWLDELPRGPNGKFDRKTLHDRFDKLFEADT